MDEPTQVIDPDGEVTIVLRNANLPFAEMDENMISDVLHQVPSGPNDYAEEHPEEIETAEIYIERPSVASRKGNKKKNKKSKVPISRSIPHPHIL